MSFYDILNCAFTWIRYPANRSVAKPYIVHVELQSPSNGMPVIR